MGRRGGYIGGSTVFGPGSSLFAYTKAEPEYHEPSEREYSVDVVTHKTNGTSSDDPKGQSKTKQTVETRRVTPKKSDESRVSLLIVRTLPQHTNKTKKIESYGDIGMKILGLDPKKHYLQVTLVDNLNHANESYTAFLPDDLAHDIVVGKEVRVKMVACVSSDFSDWLVERLN